MCIKVSDNHRRLQVKILSDVNAIVMKKTGSAEQLVGFFISDGQKEQLHGGKV